ncbi:beta-1,3-galactosyltransferase 5, partial [Asbolus verrucosus]
MGKNHRLKKKLKSERAKVHIKSKTKFLPKGQNITDTTFKIKPIVLQEQLKEKDKSLLLSKRKLSVTELVVKLKHYNDTVKVEACQELKDMIKKHSAEIIQTYLSLIIQTLSTLIQDRERKVRKASVPTFKLEAFFNHILINLKCAMTNIDKNIQEDSLLLLDALLEHKPLLIAENFEKIFPDFLTLISKLRSQATPDRTLTLNLGSKLTSVKWRIKVLSRLYAILDIIIKSGNDKNEMSHSEGVKPIFQKASESCFIPIYKNIKPYETCSFNFFKSNDNRSQVLDTQVTVLIPLLYETWLEVVPEKSSKQKLQEPTVLTEESGAIFSCVVNILNLLHEYCQLNATHKIFSSAEAARFLDHLLCNFPYSQQCLQSQNYLNSTNIKYFVKILNEILLKNPKLWHRFGVNVAEIMENLISFYDGGSVPENSRNDILEILTYSDVQFRYEKQQEWLGKLPNCLCEDKISAKLVNVILNLCKQNHKPTQEAIKNSLKCILVTFSLNGITKSKSIELESDNQPEWEDASDLGNNFKMKLFNLTFKYTIKANPCLSHNKKIFAVIIVTSHYNNVETRSAMRRAFSHKDLENLNLKRVFLLGEAPNSVYLKQESILDESKRFGDIIQGNFLEAYRNLTYKHIMGLKWVSEHCQTAKYVIKMDDDIVVNIEKTVRLLNDISLSKSLMAGYILRDMLPIREPANKWYVTKEEYRHSKYPPFVSGWFYVTTPKIAGKLVFLSHYFDYFWIDDVYVTGILTQKLRIKLYDLKKYFTLYPEFLQCCMNDIQKRLDCDILVGPNGGDNNLFYEFNK